MRVQEKYKTSRKHLTVIQSWSIDYLALLQKTCIYGAQDRVES